MSNRTAKPIPQSMGNLLNQYTQQTKQDRRAYLGDGLGSCAVAPNPDNNGSEHYGRYWIRFGAANDNSGNTQYGEKQKARVQEFLHFEEREGLPLRVRQSRKNGEWVIVGIDSDALVNASVNPSSYNFNRALNSLYARMLRDGRVFIPNQLNSGDTLYTVESYIGLWDGDRQFYEHGRGVSDNLDLASYIPSAGNEHLVLIAYLPYEQSYQVVSGASRTMATTNFDLAYLNDMAEQLSDYAEPKGCIRLRNAQDTVTAEDYRIDVRQWLNSRQARGFPMTISTPTTIISGYQQTYHGTLTVSNTLKLDGSLVYL